MNMSVCKDGRVLENEEKRRKKKFGYFKTYDFVFGLERIRR